jgi:hypothetical protein
MSAIIRKGIFLNARRALSRPADILAKEMVPRTGPDAGKRRREVGHETVPVRRRELRRVIPLPIS